jgi:AraC-like DNA-binding protein
MSVCHGAFGRAALYRLDKSLITHAHREGHLIFHIEECLSSVVVNGVEFDVDECCAAAVSPLEPHCFNIKPDQASVVLVIYIKPIWFLENSQSADFTLRFGSARVVRTQAINNLVRRFTSLLLADHCADSVDTLLFNLAQLCYEQSWQSVAAPGLLESNSSRVSDYRIRRSLRMMQGCMSAETEMEEVARAVGLSRPHFFKLFKKQLGITPNVYLNTLRSERAIDDLINTNKTVTDIAHDLGYSSQASFTRFFSSNVGIAPSEYRRVADNPAAYFPL